jgi:hypothetical protein
LDYRFHSYDDGTRDELRRRKVGLTGFKWIAK